MQHVRASLQVRSLMLTVEDELRDLNGEYKRVAKAMQDPSVPHSGTPMDAAPLRELVLRMEHKSAQLKALRGVHHTLATQLSQTKSEMRRARASPEYQVETAAIRWQRKMRMEAEAWEKAVASGHAAIEAERP